MLSFNYLGGGGGWKKHALSHFSQIQKNGDGDQAYCEICTHQIVNFVLSVSVSTWQA